MTDTDDVINALRSEGSQPEILQNILADVQTDEADDIDIPNRSQLFTNTVQVPEGSNQVKVKGNYLHVMYARIINQLNQGQSPIIIIVGKEGLGKSMTALVVANTLHRLNVLSGDFDPENQTLYDVLEFLFKVRNSTREVIMVDEANEAINVNEYHSPMNKAVASTLRTQRKRENVYIFVAPELQKIDSRVRDKVDVLIDMKKEQFASVTTFRLKHGKRKSRGKDYKKQNYPAYAVPDVDDELKKQYEKVDNEFKGKYLDDMIKEVIRERIEKIEKERTATL